MSVLNPDETVKLFGRKVRSVHALGVAGMGLGPLAIYLAGMGLRVSGGDDGMVSAMRTQLLKAGVTLMPAVELPKVVDLVVISSAIQATHPALAAAEERGAFVVRRGELLAEIAKKRKLVAVCGSHGKTTTTAMLAMLLRAAGAPFGYVLGGLLADETLPPARVGEGDWLIAEIDESDGTISGFSPEITLVVNLDWDHPDHYRKPEDLEATFAGLFKRTTGAVLILANCAWSARALAASGREARTFGPNGDYALKSVEVLGGGGLALQLGGRFGDVQAAVRAWGEFNALNAVAAGAAAAEMGVVWSRQALADFPGVRRRQAVLPADEGVTVIEDYAHHPAEIRALLTGLRARATGANGGCLRVVFQPHRFSRTAQFKNEFAAVLAAGADEVILLEVYSAGESPLAGGTSADVAAIMRQIAPALPLVLATADNEETTLIGLSERTRPGDLVAFVGAGDIDLLARSWAATRRWDALAKALAASVSTETVIRREEPLAAKTTMRVGGAARLYAEPGSVADLKALLRAARAAAVPVNLLGRGSNLIVVDEGVDGLVISLRQPAWGNFEPLDDGCVRVGAGLRLKELCGKAIKAGLGGFEFLEGIPGNLGGALRMNAGAMGGWMFDVVVSVDLITLGGELHTLRREDMHVGYRHCDELESAIAVGAVLRPSAPTHSDEVARQVDAYRDKRKCSQPREPSAGCIFKNPEGDSAGRLIDAAGLKGERVGDAEVSPVHANFIVNHGNASAADVIALVRRVRARVQSSSGIMLEPEALLYGGNWPDVL